MNPTSSAYQRGRDAARRAIENSVAIWEHPTERSAALHHHDVAAGALGNGDDWSQGWISWCKEVAEL